MATRVTTVALPGSRPDAWIAGLAKDAQPEGLVGQHRAAVAGLPTIVHCIYNQDKCRFRNIPLYDDTRVVLKPLEKKDEGKKAATFIHASWVDPSGAEPLVLTQAPMPPTGRSPGTQGDFWRMVRQIDANVIVCLCPMDDSERYWKDKVGKTAQAKPYSAVETTRRDLEECWIRSELLHTIKTAKKTLGWDKERHKLVHFHVEWWDDAMDGIPNLNDVLRLVDAASEESLALGSTRDGGPAPIVVHCDSGGKRSGLFAAAFLAGRDLRRSGGRLHVPDVAKRVKTARYGTITTKAQYMDIYRSATEYACNQGILKRTTPHVATAAKELAAARATYAKTDFDATEKTTNTDRN